MHQSLLLSLSLVLVPFAAGAESPRPGPPLGSPEAVVQHSASKEQLGARLIQKWQRLIQETPSADISEWQSEMQAMINRADVMTLQDALQRNIYQAMVKTLKGDPTSDEQASFQVAEQAEALGLDHQQMKALGDVDKDLVFVPITPCRIVDTRVAGGVIAANTTRSFDVSSVSNYSFQGGEATNCNGMGAAGSFAALAARMTVITPGSDGYITAFAFNTAQPLAATINYRAGEITADYTTVQLDQGAAANELSVYSFAQTHLIIEAVGYYQRTGVPSLECQNTADGTLTLTAGATGNVNAPNCPVGFIQTATNCEATSWDAPFVYLNSGTCSAKNNSTSSVTLRASRTCCRTIIN